MSYIYLWSYARVRQNVIQTRCDLAMKFCSRSTVFIGHSIWPRTSWYFSKELCKHMLWCSGLLVKTVDYNVSISAYLQWLRCRKINSNGYCNEGVKQNKNPNSVFWGGTWSRTFICLSWLIHSATRSYAKKVCRSSVMRPPFWILHWTALRGDEPSASSNGKHNRRA